MAQAPLKTKQLTKMEKRIDDLLENLDCVGASVAVVQKDRIVYTQGFGYRDRENEKPVTANTLFAIGSCTKAFTAAMAGQLVETGSLNLDESPRAYLPDFSFYNQDMNHMVTVRDMLCHRTGLPRHDLSWYFFPSDSRDSLVQRVQYHEPVNGVRERYQYNNFMYMTVGAISEKLAGNTWENEIQESIFTPLGMTQSGTSIEGFAQSSDAAIGYSSGANGKVEQLDYYPIGGMAPAGCINSSAQEMSNWLITWINDGKFKGQQVIPEEFVYEATSAQVSEGGGYPSQRNPDMHMRSYGFGWSLSSYRGHYRVEHGGNIDGFSASVCFFPSDSVGIVVLVNQNHSSVPSILRNMISDEILGLKAKDWDGPAKRRKASSKKEETASDKSAQVSGKIEGTQPSRNLSAFTGKFSHRGYGSMRIVLKGDSLIAHLPGASWLLKHHHYDVFSPLELVNGKADTADVGSFFVNFRSNIRGEVDGISMNAESSLDPLVFHKITEKLQVEVSDLEPYVGAYDLGGALAQVSVQDGVLTLLVPGQPQYTLIPYEKHKFTAKELEGYSINFEEEDGKIKAMLFLQPNGTFRIPKK